MHCLLTDTHETSAQMSTKDSADRTTTARARFERTQTIFGGGKGGRSDACCNRSDTKDRISMTSTDGTTNAIRSGRIEVGKQNPAGPWP